MIILGIDPGLASTGFGAIMCKGKTPITYKMWLYQNIYREFRREQIVPDS